LSGVPFLDPSPHLAQEAHPVSVIMAHPVVTCTEEMTVRELCVMLGLQTEAKDADARAADGAVDAAEKGRSDGDDSLNDGVQDGPDHRGISHSGFPVLDKTGHLVGVVTRSVLVAEMDYDAVCMRFAFVFGLFFLLLLLLCASCSLSHIVFLTFLLFSHIVFSLCHTFFLSLSLCSLSFSHCFLSLSHIISLPFTLFSLFLTLFSLSVTHYFSPFHFVLSLSYIVFSLCHTLFLSLSLCSLFLTFLLSFSLVSLSLSFCLFCRACTASIMCMAT
jgi:hypothetical protein